MFFWVNQSLSEVIIDKSNNLLITFDIQLKTALKLEKVQLPKNRLNSLDKISLFLKAIYNLPSV